MDYSIKKIIVLLMILGISAGSVFFLVTTVLFSFPVLVLFSPGFVVGYLLLSYTPVGKPFKGVWRYIHDIFWYRMAGPKKHLWFFFYELICWLYPNHKWRCMNYGYAIISKDGKLIKNLKEEDEGERFQLQLYHFTASEMNSKHDCKDLNILEVGCGRGGGLNYICNYLNPTAVVGIDFSFQQIEFCKNNYSSNEKMSFYQGDAENFVSTISDIKQNSFDLVINVESSHCYGSIPNFVKQVSKVLKQDGIFCITDFRQRNVLEQFEADLQSHDMKIVDKKDITINITQALKLDEQRKIDLIEGMVGALLKPIAKKFSGVEGSRINEGFNDSSENGTAYVIYVLKRKNDHTQ